MKGHCILAAALSVVSATALGDVKIGNGRMTLVVGDDASVKSLVVSGCGEEMVDPREAIPFAAVTQDRFFHNEIKLAYPSGETTCRANSARRDGDLLTIGFELLPYEALVRVKETPEYVGFELAGFRTLGRAYASSKMKVPPVKSMRFLTIPAKTRKNFGEWLNVCWDDSAAVAVVAAEPEVRIGNERRHGFRMMTADADRDLKLEGSRAVLIASETRDFLPCLARMEDDYGLPPGVADRARDDFNASIYWTRDVTPKTMDEILRHAKRGGFRQMLIYHMAVFKSPGDYLEGDIGDYELRDEYVNGLDSLREMLAKIKAAGISPGLHLLHTFIGFNSKKYVTPVADHRLHIKKHFTLAKPLGMDGGDVYVEENPSSCPTVKEARILMFAGELVSYEGFTTERPYRFTGVRRGEKRTNVVPHPAGQIGGLLDVAEDNGMSCYVDQDSSLQDELADRFAEVWRCGFEFLCLDGCEGVNTPCQMHVANAQYRVWKKLDPRPRFTEGAAKAHFAWHHLSGANAFDMFAPELFKAMIVRWPQHEAEMMRQDFSRLSFGWWGVWLPGAKLAAGSRSVGGVTVGTQMDMWEFGTSRAAAWDCPTTIEFFLESYPRHPRLDDLLEVMRRWEDVRARKWLTPEQKEALKSPVQEHHLYVNEAGEYELHEIEMLPSPEGADKIRAFVFERKGRRVIAYWHTSGEGRFAAPVGDGGAELSLAAAGIRYVTTDLPRNEVAAAWRKARWTR